MVMADLALRSAAGGKEPRGIRGYALVSNSSTPTPFTSWKLQGNQVGSVLFQFFFNFALMATTGWCGKRPRYI